jgi:hypothetical protein
MGSAIAWIAGTAIAAAAGWLGRYALSVRKGYRHDPEAKSVWWTPGGGGHGGGGAVVPPATDDEKVGIR